jgi:oxygen-dependent protoporphyrinogen oxidase
MSVVLVVGAGVAGLSAARDLAALGHTVTVLEGSPEAGGKLRRAEVAGVPVDVGAEAMLNRRPEGVALATELSLPVEHPAVTSSRIWTGGALRPLPRSLMGVPLDLDDLRACGVLSPQGVRRAETETALPPEPDPGPGADLSVGDLVDRRFGPEVTDRLVEPLLGGVYAGHARDISVRAAVPQLLTLATRGSVLAQSAGLAATHVASTERPVFAGITGGMGALTDVLAGDLDVRLNAMVRQVRRTGSGFEVTVGPASAPTALSADAVVLATPATASARLLADLAPAAATQLAGIESASVAVVTLAFRAADVHGFDAMSGFLVPPVEGRDIKAATFSFAKWDWTRRAGEAAGLVHVRTSLGRHREEVVLQRDDAELVRVSLHDLADATGLAATPVASHVQRWGGGLPQYAVGHLDRVARIRAAVAAVPGLAVCGAAYDGVGIPAVIATARTAVAGLAAHLDQIHAGPATGG